MSQKPTIGDVAKAAGVSITTVSRILNGNYKKMRPSTRQRVLKTIKELNYVPTASARRLRQSHGHVIGALVGDIANPFSTLLAKGIYDVLQAADYDIMLINTNNSEQIEQRSLLRLCQQQVDGIIVQPDSRYFKPFETVIDKNIPLVTVDREIVDQPGDIARVTSANQDACYHLGQTLADRHYQNIIAVSSRYAQASGQIPRIAGLKATALDHGFSYHNLELKGHDHKWLTQSLSHLLSQLSGRTVVISLMGPTLFDLLSTFKQLGLRFPQDVGLVSFDDWEWSQYVQNGIFLLKQDMELMGNLAAQKLLMAINGENPGSTTLLPVETIYRPSL